MKFEIAVKRIEVKTAICAGWGGCKNEPAFPSLHYKAVELGEEGRDYAAFEGMSLRDYFAAKAMEGLLAIGVVWDDEAIAAD